MSFWDIIEPGTKVRNIDGDYEWFKMMFSCDAVASEF